METIKLCPCCGYSIVNESIYEMCEVCDTPMETQNMQYWNPYGRILQ